MSNQNEIIKRKKGSTLINWLDLFGETLSIQVSGKNQQSTMIGAILGTLSILSIGVLSIYFLVDIFQLNTVNIMYNTSRDLIPTNNISKPPMVFTLTDGLERPLPTKGLYEIDVMMAHYIPIPDATGNKIKYLPIKVNYTKCDYEISFGEYKYLFKNSYYLKELFCIPPNSNNLTLHGRYSDVENGFSYMNFYVNRCKNSTNTQCVSNEEMDIKLENVYFALIFIDYQIDHYNTTQAFKPVLKTTAFSMTHTLLKRYFYYIRQIFYETDYGLIFQDVKKETFYQQDNYQFDVRLPGVSLSSDSNFGLISILNENKIDFYNRSFKKLQDIIANIGGVLKGILICASCINYIFTRNYSTLLIVNSTFEFDDENEKKFIPSSPNFIPLFHSSTQGNNLVTNLDNLKLIRLNKPIEFCKNVNNDIKIGPLPKSKSFRLK